MHALPPDDDRPNVLLVGASPDLLAEVRTRAEEGYCVVEAAGLAEGLRVARDVLPDLVVTDVSLPDCDGIQFLESLREAPETEATPVILFSLGAVEAGSLGLASALGRVLADWEPTPRAEAAPRALDLTEAAFIEEMDAVIRERAGEVGFATAALAEAFGMCPRHLRRRLSQATGESPAQRIRRVRMETAADLLAAGGSVKEVGFAVGFSSESGFRYAFQTAYGSAPSDYRPALREAA